MSRCLRPELTACRSSYFQPSILVNNIYTDILTIMLFNTKNKEGFVCSKAVALLLLIRC